MKVKSIVVLLFLFCSVTAATGQNDSFSRFYYISDTYITEDIDKEHIPLDGTRVSMIPFRRDELYGFVRNDSSRAMLIKPEFEQVFAVYEAGAIVKKTQGFGGYGLVNDKGDFLIQPYFQNLIKEGDVFHGIIVGVIDKGLPEMYNTSVLNQYFDSKGNFLFTQKAHEQQSFTGNDTLAWFRYGRVYNIRGRSGTLHKAFRHNEKKRFVGISDNLLIYAGIQDELHHYFAYDLKGKLVFKLPIANKYLKGVHRLSANLYGLIGTDANYFFCDASGLIKPYADNSGFIGFFQSELNYFDREYFVLTDRTTSLQGIVNRNGEIKVDFSYRHIGAFVNGLAFCISSTGKHVFIDTAAHTVLDASGLLLPKLLEHSLQVLHEPIGFYDSLCIGIANVELKGDPRKGEPETFTQLDSFYFFYFDRARKIRLRLNGDIQFAGNFSEGLAPALNAKGQLGFVNTSGKWAIAPEYELAAAGAYPFPYLVVPQFIGGYAYIKSFKGYIDHTGKPYFSGKRMQDEYDFSH